MHMIKLVADSSANLHENTEMEVAYAPLKIVTSEKEYVDDGNLDVPGMLQDLKEYKGKSSTACPSVGDWLQAFGNAREVLGVSITSKLSGCWNAAQLAARQYMEQFPDAKVFILDTLTTGPEMQLLLEKYHTLIKEGKLFDEIVAAIKDYMQRTHLLFSLESLNNFARNGRVSPAVAKVAGILGLRIVGSAKDGDLDPAHKCRGEKKALAQIFASMKEMGYKGGKVRITHSYNLNMAETLRNMIRGEHPESDVTIGLNRGLCCFYCEEGGLLVGFES